MLEQGEVEVESVFPREVCVDPGCLLLPCSSEEQRKALYLVDWGTLDFRTHIRQAPWGNT